MLLFTLGAYFSLREIVQLILSKSLYWADIWNNFDLARCTLLIALALVVRGEHWDRSDANHLGFGRKMMLGLAVMVYLGVISFFRMAYLPIALFVGGISQIVITLIPFMITFFLAMALFAYGYWVGGFASPSTGELQGYPE